MIDLNDLSHNVEYQKIIDTCTFDDYGQPIQNKSNITTRCFYDFPKQELFISDNENKIKVLAILFMLPTAEITLEDIILKVSDNNGDIIDERKMKVGAIRKANDGITTHHLEVLLTAK